MRFSPPRYRSERAGQSDFFLTSYSPEFGISNILKAAGAPGNSNWVTANISIALPFRLNRNVTFSKIALMGGSSGSVTADVGIYDSSRAQMVSIGATPRSGLNVWQWFDIADTLCVTGDYYLGIWCSGTAATNWAMHGWATAAVGAGMGIYDTGATTSAALPSPFGGALSTALTRIPAFIMQGTQGKN